MKKTLLLLAVFLGLAAALSAAEKEGRWDKLTDGERARLQKGEVIYRSVKTVDEEGQTHGHGQSLVIIKKPVDRCFEIFTDFDSHEEYFPRKTESEVIGKEGETFLVQKKFSFWWVDIEYVVRYEVDPKEHRVDFFLDKNYPHDLEYTEGYFAFEELSPEKTLFVYGAEEVDISIALPGFVQEWLQKRDLPAVAENVRKRIESGGKWKKE